MKHELQVWLQATQAGTLFLHNGRLHFTYAASWLSNPAAVPLSHSLPLNTSIFNDLACRPFFAGLLPEGSNRGVIARLLQVSRQNDFGLLEGLGGECAGAVSLLLPGQLPVPPAECDEEVDWLAPAALTQLLRDLPQRPMLVGEQGLRLSLAGAQDKLPVRVRAVAGVLQIGLALQQPSTHILKPAIQGVVGSVFNEAFCLRLAARLGLRVAGVSLTRSIEGEACLLVERYDRVWANDHWQRLHQEDFCQALGVVPEQKYQHEGGPGLSDLFTLLRQVVRPSAPQVLMLLDFVMFNALVGNHDAHGKNFSLLRTEQGLVLAPLYDVLCTAVYPQLTDRMAMKVGSRYRFTELELRHWQQFAEQAGLSPAQVRRRLMTIAKQLPDLAREQLAYMQLAGEHHAVLDEVLKVIEHRCALTLKRQEVPA